MFTIQYLLPEYGCPWILNPEGKYFCGGTTAPIPIPIQDSRVTMDPLALVSCEKEA